MNNRIRTLCIWSGPVGFLLFGLGMLPLANFFPLPSPAASAADIAAIYSHNTVGIRLGAILVMLGASLFVPFFAVVSDFLRRIEGRAGPCTWTQAMGATLVVVCFFIGPMMLAMTSFRPERPVELTQLMNDMAWLMLVSPGAPGTVQTLAIAFAIFGDRQVRPMFPRWFAFFSLWVAVLFLPAELAVMFKTGPFAWNGLFAFYIPATLVGIWSLTFAVLMARAPVEPAAV